MSNIRFLNRLDSSHFGGDSVDRQKLSRHVARRKAEMAVLAAAKKWVGLMPSNDPSEYFKRRHLLWAATKKLVDIDSSHEDKPLGR